jgi:7-carboxy-7-deazaguanine synthase
MSKIKVAELFYSIQGEGRFMGVPSIFLRTFGCNFKCAGFGMPKGEVSLEANNIAYAQSKSHNTLYKSYQDLPLVNTGCDSYASWHSGFKDLSQSYDIETLAESIVGLLPDNKWRDIHLVITGGEPLLGWQKSYPDLLSHDKLKKLKDITFETNGTQELSKDFRKYLEKWTHKHGYHNLTFSVSPKLSVSGEKREDAIRPDVVCEYEDLGHTYLKFVVATKDDVDEALEVIDLYKKEGFDGHVYLMPVGGVEDVYKLNNRTVAELAMKHGLRYSDRLQVPLFKNEWGT